MNREQYYEDLRIKQEQHLKNVNKNMGLDKSNWQPCMHEQ